jgi:protein-tyrosine phosphatase
LIDLHSHILPYWDDGSDSWATSLSMLREGAADGIREVVCTPHIMSKKDFDAEETILLLYQELKQRAQAEKLDLKIHLGAELWIQPDIDFSRRIATYNHNQRYFLVEFPMNLIPDYVAKTFFDCLVHDLTPVVAHPERYIKILADPAKAYDFVDRGALLQVNAGSLLGIFGQSVKHTAMQLIDHHLVSVVASDAHDPKTRPLKLKSAYDLVAKRWGAETSHRLFVENPRRILHGQDVILEEPIKPADPSSRSAQGWLKTLLRKVGIK